MKSMTGYGQASWNDDKHNIEVEIRSVNGRFFKFSSRIPQEYNSREIEIKGLVANKISRGTVSISIEYSSIQETSVKINSEILKKHYSTLKEVSSELEITPPRIEALLSLPEVVIPISEKGISDKIWEKTQELVDKSLDQVVDMREKEGQLLVAELNGFCEKIRFLAKEIEACTPKIIEDFKQRVQLRMQQFLEKENINFSEQDILKELSIFSEKVDINEELSRLQSHVLQFEEKLLKKEPIGKTLEFLTQEMLRETNTIAAKANNASCSQNVVQIKTYLEKIREQIQNVE